MKSLKRTGIISAALTFMALFVATPVSYAATSPSLGDAASYSVLGSSTVTNTGPTTMPGDLGVYAGSAVIGFPPGVVGPPGSIHAADANAAAAQIDNTAAFGFLDQTCDTNYGNITQDLTLVSPLIAGVYCADAFSLSGNLTLSGTGVWIFKAGLSTLITSPGSSVSGGDPCNVWWRVASSATLATTTSFIGNILALTSITLDTGATLNGRALAQTGQVSLNSNVISGASCLTASTTSTTATPVAIATTPGLPNAGFAPRQNNSFWIAGAVFVITLSAIYVARKKV